MRRVLSFVWRERMRLARFLLIGGLSFILSASLYYLFSRVLWVSGNRTLENFFAIVLAGIFNFIAHRSWTFDAKHESGVQLLRYILVVIFAMSFQSFLFWLGHSILHMYDFFVIVITTGIIACCTFLTHKYFTFREKRVMNNV